MVALPPDVERIVDALYLPARQAIALQLSSLEIKIFVADAIIELALLFGFYFSGLAARLRDALERRLGNPLLVTAAFVVIAFYGLAIVLLPLHWYSGFVVLHAYGLSNELPSTWFHDWAVGDAVSLVVFLAMALAFRWSVRVFAKRWPLAAAVASAPLILFGNAIYPAYVAPLFNSYTAMPPSPLTHQILSLAFREGIDARAVYEYDMSKQTTVGNAYVAGIGPTARIAVGDNLLKNLKPDEVLYVVAHEMGHYKLHHIWWGSLYGWLGAIAAIGFLAWAGAAIVDKTTPRLARNIDDPAALPLLAGLLLGFALATAPVANGISRSIEHAADVFAASVMQHEAGISADTGVRAFARLGSQGLSVLHPNPLVVWYFYTHPPLDERITYAATAAGLGHDGLTAFSK